MSFTYPEPAAPAVDIEAIDQALTDLRARREREDNERRAHGGPCRYCGVEESWVVPPPEHLDPRRRSSEPRPAQRGDAGAVGRWYEPNVCSFCWVERRRSDGEDDHRATVLYRLLPEARGRWLPGFMLERFRLPWWEEVPGARPGGRERFAHVDLDAARAALFPPPPEPEYETLDPCPRCGVADRWVAEPVYVNATATVELDAVGRYVTGRRDEEFSYLRASGETRPVCRACSHVPRTKHPAADLDEFVARVVGVWPDAERRKHDPDNTGKIVLYPGGFRWRISQLLGVCWFADTGRTEPAASPFDWWEPIEVLRAQAYERYPERRYWVNERAWARAREAATVAG